MIRALLRALWAAPWPPGLRRLASDLASMPGLRLLLLPQFMVGVVGLIEDGEGRILLLEHTYRTRFPWGLPTGFLEHGEQPRSALSREIGEETGFSVSLAGDPIVQVSQTHPVVSILYRGRYESGTFTAGPEVSSARFFHRSEFPPLSPEQQWLVDSVLREDHDQAD